MPKTAFATRELELVDGDLCDITLCTRSGRRRYCGQDAVLAVVDVDGRERLMCADHAAVCIPEV